MTTQPAPGPSAPASQRAAAADSARQRNSTSSSTPARSALARAASMAPASRSEANTGGPAPGRSDPAPGLAHHRGPGARLEAGPALQGEAAAESGSDVPGGEGRFDGDRARPTERIAQGCCAVPTAGRHGGGGQRLPQWRLGPLSPPTPAVERLARAVDAEHDPVVEQAYDDQLRCRGPVGCLVGCARQPDRAPGPPLAAGARPRRRCGRGSSGCWTPGRRVGRPVPARTPRPGGSAGARARRTWSPGAPPPGSAPDWPCAATGWPRTAGGSWPGRPRRRARSARAAPPDGPARPPRDARGPAWPGRSSRAGRPPPHAGTARPDSDREPDARRRPRMALAAAASAPPSGPSARPGWPRRAGRGRCGARPAGRAPARPRCCAGSRRCRPGWRVRAR